MYPIPPFHQDPSDPIRTLQGVWSVPPRSSIETRLI